MHATCLFQLIHLYLVILLMFYKKTYTMKLLIMQLIQTSVTLPPCQAQISSSAPYSQTVINTGVLISP